jgi:osmotically-inducible protein OsmY
MKNHTLAILVTGMLLISFAAGCETTTSENANANIKATPTATATPVATTKKVTREEYEKNKETYSQQAKDLGSKIGTGINDGWLWTKARLDLAAADDLRDSTINVDVENEVVTLSGTVATAAQKTQAETIAKAVEGVKQVKNMLKVAPASNTNANVKAK